ncbi:SdpI family protein [Bacillus sp. 1NLA3E]|uniref:SdpI family protein n=1 Tax=Bacillus sp. 1NLA3E TaxID=666686 RepID=UPI000247EB86|nr:SdpI family protein [Bacillus sp. 1NLA3E]AGK55763.1 membrane protein [Bacillus sp. 1NLA3E]
MKKHVFPIFMIGLTILAWVIAFPKLPQEVPIHWSFTGEANGYSSKLGAMFTQIGIMTLLYVSVAFLPKIDPRKANYSLFSKGYQIIYNSLLTIFFVLNVITILIGLGYDIPMATMSTLIIGAIFIIMGNFMQQVRSNFFIGIRTPWTLSNDEVWKKTHRFGGKIFFGGGVIMIFATFLPSVLKETVLIIVIVVTVAAPYAYSYWQFKKGV